jgi:hypothetical protein
MKQGTTYVGMGVILLFPLRHSPRCRREPSGLHVAHTARSWRTSSPPLVNAELVSATQDKLAPSHAGLLRRDVRQDEIAELTHP